MSNVAQTKVTQRRLACAVFNTVLPYREEVGNRKFRNLVMMRIEDHIKTSSAAVMYNYAKGQAIEAGLTPDFGRAAGDKVGPRIELDAALETTIREKMDKAIGIVTGDEDIALKAGLKWKVVDEDGSFVEFTKTKKAGVSLAKEGQQVVKVAA